MNSLDLELLGYDSEEELDINIKESIPLKKEKEKIDSLDLFDLNYSFKNIGLTNLIDEEEETGINQSEDIFDLYGDEEETIPIDDIYFYDSSDKKNNN